jgi:APA family basic amino acid/polyamine antiporter
LTLVVLAGIRRSNRVNAAVVSITLSSLILFVVTGLPRVLGEGNRHFEPFFTSGTPSAVASVLQATALMFVAYTGYARVVTLGEEVHEPRRTIPRAIVATLALTLLLYVAVSVVAVGTLGAQELGRVTESTAAPLEIAAARFDRPAVRWVVALGATTAMLGVMLNLILGLSRVLLAMGRRGDMPAAVARLNASRTAPSVAVLVVGGLIAGVTLLGSVRTTWSFSAFSVLVYYAITNLAALRLSAEERLYHPAVPWCGLCGCLFVACWVEWRAWAAGLGWIALALLWHAAATARPTAGSRD